MKDIQAAFAALVERPAVLLIVLGTVVALLGPMGGIRYGGYAEISDTGPRIAATAIGIVIFAVGAYFTFRAPAPLSERDVAALGVRIDYPTPGSRVGRVVDVRGTIAKPIPKEPYDYELWIFRVYPERNDYVGLVQAQIDHTGSTWVAYGCNVGGRSNDHRYLAAYLVGQAGRVLLDYERSASDAHRKTMKALGAATGNEGDHLPAIRGRTPDMVECTRVPVVRD